MLSKTKQLLRLGEPDELDLRKALPGMLALNNLSPGAGVPWSVEGMTKEIADSCDRFFISNPLSAGYSYSTIFPLKASGFWGILSYGEESKSATLEVAAFMGYVGMDEGSPVNAIIRQFQAAQVYRALQAIDPAFSLGEEVADGAEALSNAARAIASRARDGSGTPGYESRLVGEDHPYYLWAGVVKDQLHLRVVVWSSRVGLTGEGAEREAEASAS